MNKMTFANLRNQKKDTFSITKKGFTFTLGACGESKCRLIGDNKYRYEPSGYVVNGYPIDENEGSYFIECYQYFCISAADTELLQFKFSAVINDESVATFSEVDTEAYNALMERIAINVLEAINTYG